MNKLKLIKIGSFILIVFLFLYTVGVKESKGDNLSDLNDQISSINGQINNLQNNINDLQKQSGNLISQKNSLQLNLNQINSLINSTVSKENQINTLLKSLDNLKQKAQDQLNKEILIRDQQMQLLYESSQENPTILLISSADAKTFFYNLAYSEMSFNSAKDEVVLINSNIKSLQLNIDNQEKEKKIQDEQIASLNKQRSNLQASLSNINNQASQVNSQLTLLKNQLGNLNAEEQSIIDAKSKANNQGGGVGDNFGNGNSGSPINNPGGDPGSFNIFVNKNLVQQSATGPIIIQPNDITGVSDVSGNSSESKYTGNIEFRSNTDINFINQTSTENYVKGIGEMPSSWSLEALKVQAVAARTYGLRSKGKYGSLGYDISDSTADQVYDGYNKAISNNNAMSTAADQTKGLVLYNNGSLISSVYSANNGGYERSNKEVWNSGPSSYLPSQSDGSEKQYNNVSDPAGVCKNEYSHIAAPNFSNSNYTDISLSNGKGSFNDIAGVGIYLSKGNSSSSIYPQNDYSDNLTSAIGTFDHAVFSYTNGKQGNSNMSYDDLVNVVNSSSGNSDYLDNVTLYGSSGNITISGIYLNTAYNLKSPGNDYVMLIGNGSVPYPPTFFTYTNGKFYFYSFGFGHSIGMSQCGSEGRAENGQNYSQILNFYYPNTSISPNSQIINSDENSCLNIGNSYSNTDGCIRIGITPKVQKRDNTVVESNKYTIYSNGNIIFSKDKSNPNDSIEIIQN